MRTHVALLRGVNVGGRSRLAMSDLKELVEDLGHTEVATYLQSGNVVFRADARADTTELGDRIGAGIASRAGVACAVQVRSRSGWARVRADCPFPTTEPRALHAVLFGALNDEIVSRIESAGEDPGVERVRLVGDVAYLWTPDGFGRSPLVAALSRGGRHAPLAHATARNWATVTAIDELLGE